MPTATAAAIVSPPLSPSLAPNPMTLYPGPGGSYAGPVNNRSASNSKAPWTVMAVVVPTTGAFLDKTRWTFTLGAPTADGQNQATLTLAANSATELGMLQSGCKLIVAVKYQGNAYPDYLYVGLTGM